jgi:hypothetical protein
MVGHKKAEPTTIFGCKKSVAEVPLFLHVLWLLATCFLLVRMNEILAMKA